MVKASSNVAGKPEPVNCLSHFRVLPSDGDGKMDLGLRRQ
jgi:hypothetical protein